MNVSDECFQDCPLSKSKWAKADVIERILATLVGMKKPQHVLDLGGYRSRYAALRDVGRFAKETDASCAGFTWADYACEAGVPRYFIDTNDDEFSVHDDVGEDFTTLEEAREMALSALPDMARDKMPNGDRRTFCVSVRDESGTVLYKATLTLTGEWRDQSACAEN